MIVHYISTRLKMGILGLFLSIPLVICEMAIATQTPLWNLPYETIEYTTLLATIICLFFAYGLSQVRAWATPLITLFASFWILISIIIAVHIKYPPLGFFSLFLIFYFILEIHWIKKEVKKPFYHPEIPWYQGLPQPIPGLKCEILFPVQCIDVSVSKITEDGVFVFLSHPRKESPHYLKKLVNNKKIKLSFQFQNQTIYFSGIPTVTLERIHGFGIQFIHLSPDLKKDLYHFIEMLRVSGYCNPE